MPNTPILTPVNTPPATPPISYDNPNIHGFTPPSNDSQYSSDYNDEWDNYMNNPNVTTRRRASTNDDDDFIQGRALTMNDLDGEEESPDGDNSENYLNFDNESDYEEASSSTNREKKKNWGEGLMPPTPDYPKQIIDINANGYDPMMMENVKVEDYLKGNLEENVLEDNIAILYNGKTYLTSRSIIEQQENDALVYECLEGGMKIKEKMYSNVIGNLPLYNIKKIGIDISSDNAAGIEPEYIYMDGIDELLTDENFWQYYSIIPLLDKQLVSVISSSEAAKLGSDFSGVSALHCQAGQGGLAGIMVKAYPSNISGGRKKRTIKQYNKKKYKTIKKRTNRRSNLSKKRKTIKKRKLRNIYTSKRRVKRENIK